MRLPTRPSRPLAALDAAPTGAATAPRSPVRRLATLGGLATAGWWATGCGGGGGGGGTADTGDGGGGGGGGGGPSGVPSISSLTFSATALTAGPTPATITGSLAFIDAGRDLATLTFELVDASGALVGGPTVAVGPAAGLEAGTLPGPVTAVFPTPGAYRVRTSVRDEVGNVSNVLEGPLRVAAPPWTACAAMPTPREGFCVAQVGGCVYAIGGVLLDALGTPKPATGTVETWDPANNRWTTLAPMPPARWGASAATLGARVSVIGGSAGGLDVATLDVYDDLANTWSGGVALPSRRRFPTAFTLLNGGQPVLQSIGGYASTEIQNAGYLARWERLAPGAAAWGPLPMPPTARARVAVVDTVPALYAIGGQNVERALATVGAWDLTTLSWRTRTPLPAPAATPGAAVLADGRVVVVDGRATCTYVPADDLA
jgi:hypothetical protein